MLQKYTKPCFWLSLESNSLFWKDCKLFSKNCHATVVTTCFFKLVILWFWLKLWYSKVSEQLAAMFYSNFVFWIWKSVDFGFLQNRVLEIFLFFCLFSVSWLVYICCYIYVCNVYIFPYHDHFLSLSSGRTRLKRKIVIDFTPPKLKNYL